MKNIHVLPTPNPSRIIKFNDDRLDILPDSDYRKEDLKIANFIPQHIYITSDEKVKDGDFIYDKKNNFVYQVNLLNCINWITDNEKKVILTTDPNLRKNGIQSIPDDFVKWFINNSICESVEVRKECCGQCDERQCEVFDLQRDWTNLNTIYKIIIPKEEPKQIKCYEIVNLINNDKLEPKQHVEVINNNIEKFDEMKKQLKETEERGRKVFKYLNKYKGQNVYNDIALAIEFGYQLRLKEEEQEISEPTPEEETLSKIKFVLSCKNDAQAIRLLEQYGSWKQENLYTKNELLEAFSEPFGQGGLDRDEYKSRVMNKLNLDKFEPFK